MTVAYSSSGTASAVTPNPTPSYPATIAAGDLLLLHVSNKYPNNGPSTPSGWTLLNQATGGHGSAGADAGNVYSTVYYKIADGTETGSFTVTVTSSNTSLARVYRVTKASTAWFGIASAIGASNTPGLSWSATGDVDPGITAGDLVLTFSSVNGDVGASASTHLITASGVTFTSAGVMTERNDDARSTGDDVHGVVASLDASSGTSNAAPVYTCTFAGTSTDSPAGGTVFVRVRETTNSGTLAVTLEDTTVVATGTVAVAGTLAVTLADTTVVATGTVAVAGTLAVTLADTTVVATGTVLVAGVLAVTLEDDTVATDGHVVPVDSPVSRGGRGPLGGWSGWSNWLDWQ